MTHDELIMRLWEKRNAGCDHLDIHFALSAVAELHKPLKDNPDYCDGCYEEEGGHNDYPCPTIQSIEKELG